MSITLTTAYQVSINGTSVENDLAGAVVGMSFDFLANTAILSIARGIVKGAEAFSVGSYAARDQVVIALATGAWSNASGSLTGTLSPAALTTLQNFALNARNGFETFLVNNSIMPGTQVPWTVA